jgi:hypothetical protein
MLLFCDGFGHYNQLQQKWTFATNASISSASARSGTQGCTNQGTIAKSTPYRSTFFIGCAIRLNVGGSYGGVIYELAAPVLGGGNQVLVTIQVEGDASIGIYAGGNLIGNTALPNVGTTPFFFNAGVFFYVEFEIQLSGSITATVSLRVNNNPYLSAVSGNTGVSASSLICQTAAADYHLWGNAQVNGSTSIADIYINDDVAVSGQPFANTYRGDIQVGPYLVPRADGTTQWSESSGAPPSYVLVNEVPPDGDTTYVYDYATLDEDSFPFSTVASLVGEIQAAHYCIFQRKDNEGSRVTQPLSNGSPMPTTSPYGNLAFLADNYYYYTYPMDVDPSTNAPFTVTSINASQFGIEIYS